jgi:predicted dehydrogenase
MSRNISPEDPVSVVLVGIGGYGYHYLETLLRQSPDTGVRLQGAVDPLPGNSGLLGELKKRKIPLFSSLEEFSQSGLGADLTVISSPIHCHVPQACLALKNGSAVLCEKPLGAAIQEAEELIRARDETGLWVMIGYQWCYTPAIQRLKGDIVKGVFGKPLRAKTLCLWPRTMDYYERNDWAGKKRHPDGRWILDSPANNAMAHFLHNLLFLLGGSMAESARPASVTAELYRAYPIENFDTAACRAVTTGGTELFFYASHAVPRDRGPLFCLEFEGATVTFGDPEPEIVAQFTNGRERRYGSPDDGHRFRKLFTAVQAVNRPAPVICGPEAALCQTLCVNGMQESMPEIVDFPPYLVKGEGGGRKRWVQDLEAVLLQCYRRCSLPSEAGVSWGVAGETVDLRDYRYFPGGQAP